MNKTIKLGEPLTVEPFIIDLPNEKLLCPWCGGKMMLHPFRSIFHLMEMVSSHIGAEHPDKHYDVAISFVVGSSD